MAELQPIPEEQQTGEGGAYISDRFRVDANAPAGKPANYTFAGLCAILAFILFAVYGVSIAITFLQNRHNDLPRTAATLIAPTSSPNPVKEAVQWHISRSRS